MSRFLPTFVLLLVASGPSGHERYCEVMVSSLLPHSLTTTSTTGCSFLGSGWHCCYRLQPPFWATTRVILAGKFCSKPIPVACVRTYGSDLFTVREDNISLKLGTVSTVLRERLQRYQLVTVGIKHARERDIPLVSCCCR